MPIPSANVVAACLLRALGDGRCVTLNEARDELADELRLSANDRAELLHEDGRETRFGNRVGHARTLLVRLGLAEQPSRGAVQITAAGRAVLAGDRTPRSGVKGATSGGLYRRLDDHPEPRGRGVRAHSPDINDAGGFTYVLEPEASTVALTPSIEAAVVRDPPAEPHAELVPGPIALGRSIVLSPGDAVPAAWAGRPEVTVTETDLIQRTETVDHLHRAWAWRRPLVIRLDVDADALKRPRSWDVPLWQLEGRFDPWTDRLLFLVWNNSYDGRGGRQPRWYWTTKASRAGAVATPDGPADVRLPSGESAWVDGGPRRPFPAGTFGDQHVLHYLDADAASLPASPPLTEPRADLAADQLEAVRHVSGAARVIAPAGSGKTRVLTERLRHLIVDRRYPREQVVAVVYNKRAQDEFVRRTRDFSPRVQTLNSLGWEILRDAQQGVQLLKDAEVRRRFEQQCPPLEHRANTDAMAPYLAALQNTRQGLLDPSDVETQYSDVAGFANAFRRYRAELTDGNVADFDEQLYRSCELLLADADLRRRWQARCRHVLVDEFQDLTPLRLLMLRTLASPALDVFGTGDDDQVIYGYEGADPRFLIEFADLFPGASAHALEVNYRCTPAVVSAASTLLTHNRIRVHKQMRAARTGDGARGFIVLEHSPEATAATIVAVVRNWIDGGTAPRDIALLSRVNAALLTPQVALQTDGVPVVSELGPERLLRTGVHAVFAYLHLALRPEAMRSDDLLEACRRPSRGFARELLDEIRKQRSWTVPQLRALARSGSKPFMRLYGLLDDLHDLSRAAATGDTAEVLDAIRQAGLERAMRKLDDAKSLSESHIDDLDSLAHLAPLHPDVTTFEAWLRDELARPSDRDGVTLATVHRVKGEEWTRVLVIDVRDGILPHRRAVDVEEERRILHVAITRGRDEVVVLTDRTRTSTFINELSVPQSESRLPRQPVTGGGGRPPRPVREQRRTIVATQG